MSETEEIVVSTRERAGLFDGLVSAKPGEIIFVVQGGDPDGPPTVLHWAHLARARGMAETNKKHARRLLRRATAAEEVAWAMRAQQRGEKAAPGVHQSYSGHTGASDAARERHEMLVKGVDRLYNSIAESNDFAEALSAAGLHPEEVAMLRQAVATLKEASERIEPRHQLRRKVA